MMIKPAHYKNSPEFIQFAEGAGDYCRDADARRQRGFKRAPDLPMWLLETGRKAGLTHAEMRSALGISSNTLSAALRNLGIALPRSNRERAQIFSAPPIVAPEQSPSATGMIAAWLSTDVVALDEHAIGPGEPVAAGPAPDIEPKRRLKLTALAEIVAKRLIGETADRLVPGTFTGRDGYQHCDGFTGRGPDARPLSYAWREKAGEVEAMLKIARDVQASPA